MKIEENILPEIKIICDQSKYFFNEENAIYTHIKNASYYHKDFEKHLPKYKRNQSKLNDLKFVDLFAGIGGFHLALNKVNGKCVFSCEWDKNAKKTYYNNFNIYPFGDINKFTGSHIEDHEIENIIPNHEILCGGFPCQPFSLAGVSARNSLGLKHGFECKTQGTLFYSIARIMSVKKPKIVFLENVLNLIRHNKGETIRIIESIIRELGYDFKKEIIDSSSVVPQRRKRCFMICVRKDVFDSKGEFIFPSFAGESIPLRSIIEENPDRKFFISERLWQGHQDRTKKNLERGTGFTAFTADLEKPSNTIVARYGKDGKECLINHDGEIRMLTIKECKKLFGFPESFRMPETKTTCYKQFGNSVVVPVVEKIAKQIKSQYF